MKKKAKKMNKDEMGGMKHEREEMKMIDKMKKMHKGMKKGKK